MPTISDTLPSWQTDLYPATYQTSTEQVRIMKARVVENLNITRRCMFKAMKSHDRRSVAGYRREIDRYARWVRNCDTQLRMIQDSIRSSLPKRTVLRGVVAKRVAA